MNDAENSSFPVVALGQIGEGTIQTTNARSLHGFMEIGKDFSTWFKDRVSQYDFTENVDFVRSEEHTSELQSLMRISYAVFCLKKKLLSITQHLHIHPQTHLQLPYTL